MKHWISVDPSKIVSGVAYWTGDNLNGTGIVKPRGTKGAFYVGSFIHDSRYAAWWSVIGAADQVIIEEGAGGRPNIVKAQGWMRGYMEAICDGHSTPYKVINVSEWRRVIREAYGVSFPHDTVQCKILAQQIVHREYGVDVSNDEADAVLIGHAAMRMGIVNVTTTKGHTQ